MDRKVIYAVVIVAILIVASAAAYVVINKDGKDVGSPSEMEDAELKVYGNINGDRYLDENDSTLISQLIEDGATAEEYPLADANRDGVIDSKDVAVIDAVVAGESTTIWHIAYHDVDGDSTMDEEVVSTKFPIKSAIISASSNISMELFALGIIDEVKGAAYSPTSLDSALYGTTYMDTSVVEQIGTSAKDIPFEDGKIGASDLIARENVTALITDWNRAYITNESDFEAAGIDVIHTSCNATERDEMIHTAMLLGLLFQKVDRAEAYLDLTLEIMDYATESVASAERVSMIVSSSTGYISSATSDYTEIAELAGGRFALEGVDSASQTNLKIAEHPEVYTYDFDYIIHLRTVVGYGQDMAKIESEWNNYTEKFKDWEHAETGQYMVSGAICPALRVAYTASVLHPECVDRDVVDELHQRLVDEFFNGLEFDVSSMMFVVGAADFE